MYKFKNNAQPLLTTAGLVTANLIYMPVVSNQVVRIATSKAIVSSKIQITLDGPLPVAWAVGDRIVITAKPAVIGGRSVFGLWQIGAIVAANTFSLEVPALDDRGSASFNFGDWDGAWQAGIASVVNLDRVSAADLSAIAAPSTPASISYQDAQTVYFNNAVFNAPREGNAIGVIFSVSGEPTHFFESSATFKVCQSVSSVVFLYGDVSSIQAGQEFTNCFNGYSFSVSAVNPASGSLEFAGPVSHLSTLLRRGSSFPKRINGDSDYSLIVETNIRIPL